MSPPWMPFYPADYFGDTRRLSTVQHGAYLLLIFEYWVSEGLPEDDEQLARIVGMTESEWRKTKPVVQAFFQEGWKHKRIEDELAKSKLKQERRQEAGKRGGNAKAAAKQKASIATVLLDENSSNALASSSQLISEAKASAPTPEAEMFRRGKQVLGNDAGGLISQLFAAKDKNVALTRAAIETASTKDNPREYVGKILKNQKLPPGEVLQVVDGRL